VTDQGSLPIICSALSRCEPLPAVPANTVSLPRWPQSQPGVLLCCRLCGRKGRFIDPFPLLPRRR
jgi:hypothetical protein